MEMWVMEDNAGEEGVIKFCFNAGKNQEADQNEQVLEDKVIISY